MNSCLARCPREVARIFYLFNAIFILFGTSRFKGKSIMPCIIPSGIGFVLFARKRSANVASATCFCLCDSEATATQHEVGHSVVATGRGVFRLSSSFSAVLGQPLKSSLKPVFISPPLRWETTAERS